MGKVPDTIYDKTFRGGWRKKINRRKDVTKVDTTVITPSGKKLRSNVELLKFLRENPSYLKEINPTEVNFEKNPEHFGKSSGTIKKFIENVENLRSENGFQPLVKCCDSSKNQNNFEYDQENKIENKDVNINQENLNFLSNHKNDTIGGTDQADNEAFEVEAILDYQTNRRGGFYLVKWRDDNVSWDSTWEPIKNLAGCERELRQFYLQRMKDHGEASDEMKPYLEVPPNPNMNITKYIEKYKNEVIKIGDDFQATILPFGEENQDTLIKEELLWCPDLISDETEITNYLTKWQGKSEDSNIADNEEALTQLMKCNYNFEDALGKKSKKTEIPTIYHESAEEK